MEGRKEGGGCPLRDWFISLDTRFFMFRILRLLFFILCKGAKGHKRLRSGGQLLACAFDLPVRDLLLYLFIFFCSELVLRAIQVET